MKPNLTLADCVIVAGILKNGLLGASIIAVPDCPEHIGPLKITSAIYLSRFLGFMPDWSIGILLILSSIVAALAITRYRGIRGGVYLLFPQTWILLLGAIGGIEATVVGHYADGTVLPHLFILNDQFPYTLFAVIHGLSIYLSPEYHDRILDTFGFGDSGGDKPLCRPPEHGVDDGGVDEQGQHGFGSGVDRESVTIGTGA